MNIVSILDTRYSILLISLIFLLLGCTTEFNLATQRQETLLYSTEKEVNLGDAVAARIEQTYEIVTDVDVNERVEKILERIVEVCDRKELVYFIKVINDDLVNAVSLPGGHIYVFRGLIEKAENDDQLASVIAHEVGHITAKHAVKRIQSSYGAMLLQVAATQTNAQTAAGVNLALNSLFSEYSQQDEFEADRLGIKYMEKAGYDLKEAIKVLELLNKEQERAGIRKFSYWRTHPHIPRRIANVNKEIKGELEFEDYIKIIGTSGE